jgi:hypothetical protein
MFLCEVCQLADISMDSNLIAMVAMYAHVPHLAWNSRPSVCSE